MRERVRMAETDLSDSVRPSVYVSYAELARDAFMRSLGMPYDKLAERGARLRTKEIRVRYLEPLTFDDEFSLILDVPDVAHHGCTFEVRVERNGTLFAEIVLTQEYVDPQSGRPQAMPDDLRRMLKPAA